jgi:hypothetical protein
LLLLRIFKRDQSVKWLWHWRVLQSRSQSSMLQSIV